MGGLEGTGFLTQSWRDPVGPRPRRGGGRGLEHWLCGNAHMAL